MDSVRLVPVASEHTAELVRIRNTPEVFARWGPIDAGFPFDDPESVGFAVLVDNVVRGLVQYSEEQSPMYRHAGIDIFLDPAVHGRGIGREVVWRIADRLIRERGHHRLVIDPAADNEPAIRCYTAVGFRPVGILRQYERSPDGTWHDGLFMDMLASELRRP
jgi:RimJ/RimL family protein N-acetyltransferase